MEQIYFSPPITTNIVSDYDLLLYVSVSA